MTSTAPVFPRALLLCAAIVAAASPVALLHSTLSAAAAGMRIPHAQRQRIIIIPRRRPMRPPYATSPGANPSKAIALKPSLQIDVTHRSFTPGGKMQIALSTFNAPLAHIAAYPIDLGKLVTKSEASGNTFDAMFQDIINKLPLQGQHPAATWTVASQSFPDQWAYHAVKAPRLAPGAYLLVASTHAGGTFTQARTWAAVTNVALLARRAPRELLLYAANATTGRPVANVPIRLCDAKGLFTSTQSTGADGMLRVDAASANGALWAYGIAVSGPAFADVTAPDAPEPYAVYNVTDRPIYRPGNLVQYKSTLRQRADDPDAPGGFDWKAYANRAVKVEIRDPTNALIEQRAVTTDGNGTLSGSLQLAAEPSLGDWTLRIVVDDQHQYSSSFSVQAYRKPEMTVKVKFDHEHFLGGSPVPATIDAQYFFGRPVASARVRYSVSFSNQDYNGVAVESSYNAVGVTDASGHLQISVPTRRIAADRTLSVHAVVTDLSRRSEQGDASTLVAAGMYRLSLDSDKQVYRPGERITMTAYAVDYDDKPVAGANVRLQMIEHKEDNQHRPYVETTDKDVVTGADGSASADFSSPREGGLDFRAESFDAQQDKILAEASVQVTADKQALAEAQALPTLSVSADKSSYLPSQQATITIDTQLARRAAQAAANNMPATPAHKEAWALVTLEGENLDIARVVLLTGRKTSVTIPLVVHDSPGTTVHVAVIEDQQLYEDSVDLAVAVPGKDLAVAITPDKAKYEPGDTATYTVSARDGKGVGVASDVSLGVVDASIYDIQADDAEDLKSFFYSNQAQEFNSDYSFAERPSAESLFAYGGEMGRAGYAMGATETVSAPTVMMAALPPPASSSYALDRAALNAPAPSIRVRNAFADTAYWNANVETDADGTAQVSFPIPDNLTTWRATGHAITLDTKVGSGTHDVVSVMPLLVRLEMPRFTVQGDRTIISAIIQNGTMQERTVHVTMKPQGASLANDAAAGDGLTRTLDLPPSGQQRCDWPMTIGEAQTASFTVTADGGAGGQDAAQGTLPVLPDGVQTVTASAATLTAANPQETIDLTQLPAGASMVLTLSPSLAAGITDAVRELADKPGGDAEETGSTLLADVVAARVLHDAGKSSAIGVGQDLDAYVSTALQTLYRYQHADGGWNWWEFDQTDGDMTASVLSALVQTNDAGYLVDPGRLKRGADALRGLLKGEQDLDRRADWLLTLSEVSPADARDPLLALYADRDKLGTYSKASLALGLIDAANGDANSTAALDAHAVALELASAATVEGRSTSWPLQPEDNGCLWSGDDVTLTAHVLRALLAITPGDQERIAGAARWLMANRDGASWDSARATAEAVLALSQYIEQSGEFAPDYTAQVALDGRSIATLTAAPHGDAAPITIALTPEELKGHKALTINRVGAVGSLYVSEVTTSLTAPIAAVPQVHGMTVKRQFRLAVDDPSQSTSVPSGSGIDVVLDIDADTDYRYVKLEDRIPAGCEVTSGDTDDNNLGPGGGGTFPIDYSDGDVGYTRQETRDDRVEFYFDSLPKGHTLLTYHLSGETPGTYRILAADAALTYQPEVRGSTALAQVAIGQ